MKQYLSNCPELSFQISKDEIKKVKIRKTEDAAEFFRAVWDSGIDVYESFFVVYLNNHNNTIAWYKASQGGITGTVADIRLIMKQAIICGATKMIVAHNHPSGNLQPSNADRDLTKRLFEAGKIMDVLLIDHIILTVESYYSFGEDGLI